jgi:hypothetical protein
MFDVSPLVPEARPIVLEASQIFYKHLHPWLTGILVHGSAYKGGSIPNCSDVDIQLYLKAEAFDQEGTISLPLAIMIHRELTRINVAPFQYIQGYTLPENPTMLLEKRQWIGPIPGAYHMVLGTLPIPEATAAQIIQSAKWTLERQRAVRADVSLDLFQHGGGKLERRVRFLCTDIWPALYSIMTLQTQKPLYIWQQCKENVIELLPEQEPLGKTIRAFYRSVYTYYTEEQSVEQALLILEQGVHFSRLATQWYQQEVECG